MTSGQITVPNAMGTFAIIDTAPPCSFPNRAIQQVSTTPPLHSHIEH